MKNKIIAVVGANGKMGSSVCKKLQNFYKIIEIDAKNSINLAKNANLVIDFSTGSFSAKVANFCEENGLPLIIGSTGQTEIEKKQIEDCSKTIPILLCKNFSVGVFLQKKIAHLILEFVDTDMTILEKHHKEKKDSPSGTALDLRDYILSFSKKNIPILAERGGSEIGTHQVDFYFGDELISVTHKAFSRNVFADGVMIAAEYMLNINKAGLYNFDEILENKIFYKRQ